MSDQAQGLRALADQTRRDHIGFSPNPNHSADTAVGTLDARVGSHDSTSRLVTPAVDSGVAVVDGRLRTATSAPQTPRARVIAVTSGKGGVGKTNFTSNLSLVMASSGQRVIA